MRQPLRSINIGSYQDAFLVSAISMVILIRLQLWATNYPQLGGGRLHIAHLLYGGLFMLVAIALQVSYLGRRWRMPAAILGGIGFGFFIDEVGKFVTKQNDYFFKPTATIIYVVFILLFFAARATRRHRGFSRPEYVMNAIDILGDAESARGLSERDKRHALALLDKAGPDPLAQSVRAALEATDAIPTPPPSRPVRWARAIRDRYRRWTDRRWFRQVLATVFVIWAFFDVLSVVAFVFFAALKLGAVDANFKADGVDNLNFGNVASVISVAVAQYFNIRGLRRLRRGERLGAYRMFDRALLVTIFITQVFVFAESSFSATTGLITSILLLFTVRYMMREEEHRALQEPGAQPGFSGRPAPAGAST